MPAEPTTRYAVAVRVVHDCSYGESLTFWNPRRTQQVSAALAGTKNISAGYVGHDGAAGQPDWGSCRMAGVEERSDRSQWNPGEKRQFDETR